MNAPQIGDLWQISPRTRVAITRINEAKDPSGELRTMVAGHLVNGNRISISPWWMWLDEFAVEAAAGRVYRTRQGRAS